MHSAHEFKVLIEMYAIYIPLKTFGICSGVVFCAVETLLLVKCDSGYVQSLHRPENELILLHVPEIFEGDRGSK